MHIFDKTDIWTTKVNFVDDNNVVLGYDLSQQCCESADYAIVTHLNEKDSNDVRNDLEPEDIKGYVFDKTFIDGNITGLDTGSSLAFRIIKGDKEAFIVLFNAHNGYYSHGFEFKDSDAVITDGSL